MLAILLLFASFVGSSAFLHSNNVVHALRNQLVVDSRTCSLRAYAPHKYQTMSAGSGEFANERAEIFNLNRRAFVTLFSIIPFSAASAKNDDDFSKLQVAYVLFSP
jgi:hypothetical protein